MAVGRAALCKHAIKLELKELKTIGLDPTFLLALETLLLDVYAVLRPGPKDYEQRRFLVQRFNALAKEAYGNISDFPIVEPFGSFVMDLFTAGSDLDLSINFDNDYTTEIPRDKKISILRRFTRSFYALQRKGRISKVFPILRARVPIVKVVDSQTGIECDVSAENKDGVSRSSILTIVSSIDERFRILSYLMKSWAKAHDINSSKDRTMNSLSIITLVAFHLQTRDPPIFPPFSALFKDGTNVSSIQNVAVGFKNFGRRNEESIAKLFVTLLIKLSAVESLWQQGLCASTFEGTWVYKELEAGTGNMNVEDFLDRSQNLARAVGKVEMKKICNCIKGSLKHLSRFMEGSTEVTKLKAHLFGPVLANISKDNLINDLKRSNPLDVVAPMNPISAKRARFTEATQGLRHDLHRIPTNVPNTSTPMNPPLQFQSNYRGDHLNTPFVPSQSSYELQYHQEPPIAPQHQYQPPFEPQHHHQLPITPQPGFEYHQQPPIAPHHGYGYGSQYHSQPSIAHPGYESQYHPQPPIASHMSYRPEYRPQLPFMLQSSHGMEYQPPLPSPHQFSFGSEHHQNLAPTRLGDGRPGNLWSGYSSQDLGRPQQTSVPLRSVYGSNYP